MPAFELKRKKIMLDNTLLYLTSFVSVKFIHECYIFSKCFFSSWIYWEHHMIFFFKHSTNVSWMHLTWSKYVILFLCVVEFILWGLVCFWFACTPEWSFRGSPWKPGFLPGHLLVCGFWAPVFVPLALKTARISAWLLGLWAQLTNLRRPWRKNNAKYLFSQNFYSLWNLRLSNPCCLNNSLMPSHGFCFVQFSVRWLVCINQSAVTRSGNQKMI